MGFILLQAGHADGALLAFDKALAVAPNLAMALWGKGMTLYQGKQDYAGAKEVFEKLLRVIPAGTERAEVEKILAEIPQGAQKPRRQSEPATPPSSTHQQISGESPSIQNSKPTSMAKPPSLSLLDLRTLPKVLPWRSRRSIGRYFPSPTHSVPKT